MNITSVQADLEAIKAEYDAKVEEIRDNGLVKIFNDFFASNPDIQAISFIGYIPGFNDGDPCVFGMGEVNFATQKADLSDYIPGYESENYGDPDDEDSEYPGWFNPRGETYRDYSKTGFPEVQNPHYNPALNEVASFIQGNYDLMNKLFGDNFKVVITKDEIKVEEYDCGY